MKPSFNDAHRLTPDYAENYCNWKLIVLVILENVVTFFGGHIVFIYNVSPKK